MTDYTKFLSRAATGMRESAIRKMGTVLAQARDIISFAPGYPDPETFPWEDLRGIAAELLSGSDGNVLQYGPTRGFKPLLGGISEILRARGIAAGVEHLLVTTGSQQGLDMVARVLLDPGDVALVELPAYTGAITAFRNAQAELVGVRQQDDGIDLADLDAVLKRLRSAGRRVRFLYVVPNFQNPTGLLLAPEKRRRLLEWADREDMLIVEDDPYREIYFEESADEAALRPMKADDAEGRVVYLSSFSKTLAPGFRVAWIAAPAPLAARLEIAKQAADLCTSGLDQRLVFECWKRGILARQIPKLRAHYRRKRDVMVDAIKTDLGGQVTWPDPRGGFFLWVTLPAHVDADVLLQRCVQHGVIYVAGAAFYVDAAATNTMRLSFSAPTPDRIREGIRRLAAAIAEELAERRETAAGRVFP
ncbi:MAG TPA: PLP-dependent aminotransferase family protein [Vicinamibacterales bacterium]|nr:PLP-dependent aminotransferase family protein [Vicinamibacterales bacterium]